jgi:hypothetical protein
MIGEALFGVVLLVGLTGVYATQAGNLDTTGTRVSRTCLLLSRGCQLEAFFMATGVHQQSIVGSNEDATRSLLWLACSRARDRPRQEGRGQEGGHVQQHREMRTGEKCAPPAPRTWMLVSNPETRPLREIWDVFEEHFCGNKRSGTVSGTLTFPLPTTNTPPLVVAAGRLARTHRPTTPHPWSPNVVAPQRGGVMGPSKSPGCSLTMHHVRDSLPRECTP